MADKNPFGGLGLNQMGTERQYMTSLISPEQKRLIKQGILGSAFQAIGAEDFFNKAFGVKPPEQSSGVPQNYVPTKDFTSGANYGFQGSSEGINPNRIGQGMGVVPGAVPMQQTAPTISVDDEIDAAWGNKKTSEFKPRDTSLDQLPQQFAQGPIAPPMSQYPQLPQTGGLFKSLTSFLG